MDRDLFCDVDGVLADFTRGYRAWYKLLFKYSQATSWDFCVREFINQTGGTKAEFWNGLTTKFWAELPKTPNCDLLMALLEPYNPVLLTSPPLDKLGGAMDGKVQWIRKHYGKIFYDGRYLIGPAKKYVAREGAVLVDDNEDHCANWEARGGIAILVPAPWNRFRDLPVVETVQEQLMDALKEDY